MDRPEWKTFANKVKEHRGNICDECNKTEGLEVHHIFYWREKMPWDYEMKHLRVLCRSHHVEAKKREDSAVILMWETYQDGGFAFLDSIKLHCLSYQSLRSHNVRRPKSS